MTNLLIIGGVAVFIFILTFIGILSRFRKCKSNQILVIYGKTGGNQSAKCIQGGAAFVWPVIQSFGYMELKPQQFECNLQKALSSQNIRVDVPTTVTVAISTDPIIMQNAAERILGLTEKEIEELVKDIVYGQMRTIIADMTIEQLNADRDKFLDSSKSMIETELKKLGMTLININITDIRDEAGYIVALGKKDQALAINNALIETAKAEQKGAVQIAEQLKIQKSTVANTVKEQEILLAEADKERISSVALSQSERDSKVAEATKTRDISVANSNSEGEIGKIEANKRVATSRAELGVVQAEADGRANSALEIAEASVQKNRELANKEVEEARAKRQEAFLNATVMVPAEVEKKRKVIEAEGAREQIQIDAQARANSLRFEAQGKSDAITLQGNAEAQVIEAQGLARASAKEKDLMAEANGFEAMIKVAENNPAIAIQYKMVDQYKFVAEAQAKAFEHMQFGNVTIMDTSKGDGMMGVMKGLISTVAPTLDLLKTMEIPGVSKALRDSDSKEDLGFKSLK